MYHEVRCVLIDFSHFVERIKKVKEYKKNGEREYSVLKKVAASMRKREMYYNNNNIYTK